MALDWIDLAIITSESELTQTLDGLEESERTRLRNALMRVLQVAPADLDRSVFRLLIERSRPFALPAALWSRPITASWSVKDESKRHLARLELQASEERLTRMNALYNAFLVTERDRRVTQERLKVQSFRCAHCGLAFCNEQLEKHDIVSPHGPRKKNKLDALKPHWAPGKGEHLQPTIDHVWPIAGYGSNVPTNIDIKCKGCNVGKSHFVSLEQHRDWTGLCTRAHLENPNRPLSFELFYAQILRQPSCEKSKKGPQDAELTVVLRDSALPAVLDNLMTVESKGT